MNEEMFMEAAGLVQIESAGGLVVNGSGEVLFITKGGKWDLPKGRLEKSDGREETAMREVVEETSIERNLLTIISPLCQTWHLASYKPGDCIKRTTWFVMEYTGNGLGLSPQLEEDITECKWIHPDSFKSYRNAMRPRIDYVSSLWKKVFFERGVHKFLSGTSKASG
ncbi:NUDIX hydrolase [Candidatus Mycalebacterium sp.]